MTSKEFLDRVKKLRTWKRGNQTAPHKPFLLLLALGRVARGEDRLVRFSELRERFAVLWRRFGLQPPCRVQYPFGRLRRRDKLWEIPRISILPSRHKEDLSAKELEDHNIKGGFPQEIYALLRSDPKLVFDATQLVLNKHFPPSQHAEIADAVGLPPVTREATRPLSGS